MNNTHRSHTDDFVSAEDWFAAGKRVYFDNKRKEIASEKRKDTITVFRRVVVPHYSNPEAQWLTMLPGFPDGSYGYAKIEGFLAKNKQLSTDIPRLYVEYVGQGNSDKPKDGYNYSTVERANLVEAHWKAQGVKTTSLVTMDFSSLVMMELLLRQKQREEKGIRYPRIEHVLAVNGGFFADGHTTGVMNAPLVRSHFGSMSSSAAQRSSFVLNKMLLPLLSKEYKKVNCKVYKKEIKEYQKVIRLHQGSRIMSQTAHFVDEHKKRADRWDLLEIYKSCCSEQNITFHIIAAEQENFEADQLELVRSRMKPYNEKVTVETIPGGHLSSLEQPLVLADRIVKLVQKNKAPTPKSAHGWTQLESSPSGSTLSSSTYSHASWTSTPRSSQVDYGLAL